MNHSVVNDLTWPLLLVVADLAYVGDDARWLRVLREVSAASNGLPVAVQVRAKGLDAAEWRRVAAEAREAITGGVPAFLNGDAATASALGYEGVHWPEADIPVGGCDFAGTRSAAVHSVAAIRSAERAGADLVVFGSVFEPGSKPGRGAGVEALREAVVASSAPVVAIGGLTPRRVPECLGAGARGVAVVSGVLGASSPGAAIEAYVEALAGRPAGAQPTRKGGFR